MQKCQKEIKCDKIKERDNRRDKNYRRDKIPNGLFRRGRKKREKRRIARQHKLNREKRKVL